MPRREFDDEDTDVDAAPRGAGGPPRPPLTTSQILRRAETNIRLARHERDRHEEEASAQRRRADAAEARAAAAEARVRELEGRCAVQAEEILRLRGRRR